MHKSARTAQTIRPSRSGSSTIQPATGQAAWQIEQAKAPKQRSGSITAMVLGAFFRGPPIILVHIMSGLYPGRSYLRMWPLVGSPTSGIVGNSVTASSKMVPLAFVAKYLKLNVGSAGSAPALYAWPASPIGSPLQLAGAVAYALALI